MLCCVPQYFPPLKETPPTFANIPMLKICIRKRRLTDSVLIQGAKAQKAPASSLLAFTLLFSSLQQRASPLLPRKVRAFTRNTAQGILCPPTSQELGTSPKGTSPYWDKVEAHPWVLHVYLCSADVSILCRWTKFMSPSPISH